MEAKEGQSHSKRVASVHSPARTHCRQHSKPSRRVYQRMSSTQYRAQLDECLSGRSAAIIFLPMIKESVRALHMDLRLDL